MSNTLSGDAPSGAGLESEPKLSGGTGLRGRLNTIIVLVALGIVLNAIFSASLKSRTSTEMLKVGDNIPAFSVELLGGGEANLSAFTGRPTVYYFFANWCPCSHESMTFIKKAMDEHAGDGLAILMVGIQDSSSNFEKFAKTHDIKYPVGINGGEPFAGDIGVRITPTTVFADADGVIRGIFVGKIEEYGQIKELLNNIVAKTTQDTAA
ncbi:hypothetical protein MNBD_NITROSPINAE01-1499 [hydrothermal vent metagenome]|uniref:Thioredoxin domain-containing protein n=1 Tax=hydrothermal vent metagenome TaxID=652676 RepID=A0A3B1CFD9_9ZZZZ